LNGDDPGVGGEVCCLHSQTRPPLPVSRVNLFVFSVSFDKSASDQDLGKVVGPKETEENEKAERDPGRAVGRAGVSMGSTADPRPCGKL